MTLALFGFVLTWLLWRIVGGVYRTARDIWRRWS